MVKVSQRHPKLTIGMPVFNGEKYLAEAIDSLLVQSFTDFELIISDNSSSDNTETICREYANKDYRISYIRQEKNIGPALNFAFLLNAAQGKYFMWAAQDFVEKAIAVLDVENDCGLVFSNFIIRNLETKIEIKAYARSSATSSPLINYILTISQLCSSMLYGVFRRELLKDVRLELFDFADIHLISEVSIKSKIIVIDEFLYIAGTKGNRDPYSLSMGKIKRLPFLKSQYQMLSHYFPLPSRIFLFLITCVFMVYNKIRLWRY
jgi:glycosyltransferase involved in cell wall biosynthesis